ncbi:MAG: hypothetical protein IRZ09_08280 [Variibacter sp.]|nr:hypothetical protein [Variibacter sp.]
MRCSTPVLAFLVAAGTVIPAAGQAPQPTAPVWPDPPAPQQAPPATVWPDPPAPPPQSAPATQPQAAPARRAPAQVRRPAPSAPDQPAAATAAPAPRHAQPRAPQPRARKPAEPAQALSCAGPFARESTHADLVAAFGAENVVFTQVDGPEGSKLDASVVYPADPQRRLEVLWHDEQARARPAAIVITGGSRWVAPGGLRLGMALGDVEKRNGKPFHLSGFGWDYGGSVVDWDNGKLDQLDGGCRMNLRFVQDGKTPQAALGKVTGEKTFASNSAEIRAVKPKVAEIIVGYGQ